MRRWWHMLPASLRRGLKIAGYCIVALAAMTAITVAVTEARCRGTPAAKAAAYQPVLEPAYRRDEVNSYLTYPEWAIVHAYEDLAGVMRGGSESDFGYLRSITGFWSSLCQVKRKAAVHGPISFDTNSTLYTIGVSFTAEMGLKGLYESTIGQATAWLRGAKRTPEDDFAQTVADDYAAFLRQVPWYEYPFGGKLWRFWAETPMTGGNIVRKLERRVASTLEYGSKGLYAKVIKMLAGLSPAPLRLRSVVRHKSPADGSADPRIITIKSLDTGAVIIETPRYREFTDILRGLAARGSDVIEIAGNANILVTVIAPTRLDAEPPMARQLFAVPLQARPGFVRVGYDIKVEHLTAFIRGLAGTPIELEHVYDY